MIQFKNKVLLYKLQIKFLSYTKLNKILNLTFIKFKTKRILANKAPKHFNIGQHSMKVRQYCGEQTFLLNFYAEGLTLQNVSHKWFYKEFTLSKNLTIRSSKIYYNTFFKFN